MLIDSSSIAAVVAFGYMMIWVLCLIFGSDLLIDDDDSSFEKLKVKTKRQVWKLLIWPLVTIGLFLLVILGPFIIIPKAIFKACRSVFMDVKKWWDALPD